MRDRRASTPFIVAAALSAFVALAFTNIKATSPTTDETLHLVAGMSYLTTGEYRLNPEHPPLAKSIAALAALPRLHERDGGDVRAEMLRRTWSLALISQRAQWFYSHAFLYGVRDAVLRRHDAELFTIPTTASLARLDYILDSDALFRRARAGMLLFALLLALLVFAWSRELWGRTGAVASLLLFCFDPNLIANGALVTTDIPVTLFIFAAVYAFWRAMSARQGRVWSVLLLCVATGAAFLTKFSAIVLIVLLPVVACATFAIPRRRDGEESPAAGDPSLTLGMTPGRRTLLALLLLVGAMASACVSVWIAYGFRYDAVRDRASAAAASRIYAAGLQPIMPPRHNGRFPIDEFLRVGTVRKRHPHLPPRAIIAASRHVAPDVPERLIRFGAEHRLLPEAYLFGLTMVRFSATRSAFLRGEVLQKGSLDYFFWTFLYKTPIPALVAIAAALILLGIGRPRGALIVLLPAVIYFAIAVASRLNIGHRHILPIYPFLYVACGIIGPYVARRRWAIAVATALVVLPAFGVLTPRPVPMLGRHLSYMNEFAGGPNDALLVDANLDWGQDLPRLAKWLREHRVTEPINLVYVGTADPKYYGIRHFNAGRTFIYAPTVQPRPNGYLAISATAYRYEPFWREFLRNHRARLVGRAGYSIRIYQLGDAA